LYVTIRMVNSINFNTALKQLNDDIPVIKSKFNSLNSNDPDKNSWKAALNFLEEHRTIVEKKGNSKGSVNYIGRVNTFVKSRKNLNRGNNKANNTKKNNSNNKANNKANNVANNKTNNIVNNKANNNKANNNKANNNKANNNKANNNKANNNTKKNNKANNTKMNNKANNNTKKNHANNQINEVKINEVKVNEPVANLPKGKDDKKILKINEHEASSFNTVPKNTHFM